MYIKIPSGWKQINEMYIKISNGWKKVNEGYIKTSSGWKKFWSGGTLKIQSNVTISQSVSPTTSLITLVGTNYYWSPGPPSLTYKFQKSTDNSTWTDISGASGTATNPAYGSSNTYNYNLTATNITKGVINYYRFIVNATYGSQNASSTSTATSFQSPTNITLTKGTVGTSTFDLSWTSSTGASRYYVYKSTDGSTYSLYTGTTATSITVSGLSSGTLYYFYVTPVTGPDNINPGYYGNDSNVVSGTTTYNQYTVTYNANGGSVSPSSATVNAGSSVVLPTPTRTGYTFTGWYTSSTVPPGSYVGGGGSSYTPSASITLYAFWTIITYTVTWDANGGSVSPTSSSVNYGSSVTAPTPSRSGYTFNGWYNASSGGSLIVNAGNSYTPSSSITLYAQWSVITYTVTYNGNGGTPARTSDTVAAGSSVTLPSATRSGYNFIGWYNPSAVLVGQAGGSYTPPSSITLTAAWTFITPSAGAPTINSQDWQESTTTGGVTTTAGGSFYWGGSFGDPAVSGGYTSTGGYQWELYSSSAMTTLYSSGSYSSPNSTYYGYYLVNTGRNQALYFRARLIINGSDGFTYYGSWGAKSVTFTAA